MKLITKKSIAATGLLTICITLVSFSALPGGDKFEIYLNNKLVMEQYVSQKASPQYLTLHRGNYSGKISVYYTECGKTGTDRSIVLKDEQNKVVKKWQFADVTADNKMMTWNVKEIMDLQSGNSQSTLKLFYSSRELPQGRLLATVVSGNKAQVSMLME
jgi:hypothetical protein